MRLPGDVSKLIEDISARHPSDIDGGTEEALAAIRDLPNYAALVDVLVRQAVRDAIYAARHVVNVRTKRQAGYYGHAAKVSPAGAAVDEAYQSVYNYHMAGTILGDIYGKDLSRIADHEASVKQGHEFNEQLARWLSTQVPADKQVRDVVPEKRLRTNFQRIWRKVYGGEAA